MNQREAFELASFLFIVGAAMIIYVSYPTYIQAAVFVIGLIVLLIGVVVFLYHLRPPFTPPPQQGQ